MTFNLKVLIRIKVYEAIYIVCPVAISRLDRVRPLCYHESLGLCGVDNLNIIRVGSAVIRILGSSTELLYDDIISLVKVWLSHQRLQYLALVFVDNCFRDKATPDLLKEIINERKRSIKLISGATELNAVL